LRILFLQPSAVRPRSEVGSEAHQAQWIKIMGDDWREEMEDQMRDLERLLDYLQERKVHVRVVLPPQATWQNGVPFATTYRNMLLPILDSRNIPVSDFSHFLSDDDFGDATHFRYSGQWKIHSAYRELALDALREMEIAH
jgi:hypothetical protein